MRVHNKQLFSQSLLLFPDAATQLQSWLALTEEADWSSSHELKNTFPQAKIIGGKNVAFKIRGNNYRLWAKIDYTTKVVYIKAIGTHKQYEHWDIQ
jgi:mRNA interferase HigB